VAVNLETSVRLQKILADAGVASRRQAEELIRAGRVTVDGRTVTELGTRADPERQDIRVDGQAVRPERKIYYLVNKPKGYLSTTSTAEGKPRVIDLVARSSQRLYTVGRLDAETEGLILVTNDGPLANRLAHPRYGVEKVYLAQVAGSPNRQVIEQLRRGVWLSEGKARPREVRVRGKRGTSTLLEITLTEGRNREIRRMLARLGHKVLNLKRVALGGLKLGGLPTGAARRLEPDELRHLEAATQRSSQKTARRSRTRRKPK
jgi:23S rRNA pseudouridine2605 synthase